MISRKIRTICFAALCSVAVLACNKDDEKAEALPSLNGQIKFEVDDFTTKKAKVTLVPRGVSHPAGEKLTYSWKISPAEKKSITSEAEDGSISYEFPDSLGTLTVTCTASATGYSTSSFSKYVTIVDKNETLSDMGFEDSDETFTDPRDSRKYRIATIGDLDWFRQNLAYEQSGLPYAESKAMNDIFGRYYTWQEAKSACPPGWRLPTEEDWTNLGKEITGDTSLKPCSQIKNAAGKLMVKAKFNGSEMWEYFPKVVISNSSKLSVIPTGYANIFKTTKDFTGGFEYAIFWTDTPSDTKPEQAYYRFLNVEEPDILIGSGDINSFAATVRCVRDKQ